MTKPVEAFALENLRGGAVVDIRGLRLLPRILFATDGSITHIVEAYAGERVDLVRLESSSLSDEGVRHGLGIDALEHAVRRVSLLQGRDSGRSFVHARAVIVLDRLPERAVDQLAAPGSNLLAVLAENRIGTFRQTIAEWEGTDGHISHLLGLADDEVLVARTYHIVTGGRPVAWVTEHFSKVGFPPATRRPISHALAAGAVGPAR